MGPSKNGVVLNVEKFIKDVEARPAIWNRNYHCNKYFLEQTWQELCKIHKLPAHVLKAKWKGLRDNFRVEFKRIPRNADGQLAYRPEYYQSKWNHFLSLQFLVDHMRQRGVKNGNLKRECNDLNDDDLNCDDEECIVEPDIHDVLVSNCMDGSEDNPYDLETQIKNYKQKAQELSNELNGNGSTFINGGSQHSSASNCEFSIPTKKSKQIENNNDDETLDLSTNKSSKNFNNIIRDVSRSPSPSTIFNHTHHDQQQHNQQQNHASNHVADILNLVGNSLNNSIGNIGNATMNIARHDDDYYYLMSLHPFMQQLLPQKKLKIRTKIQKLILKELYKKTTDA